MSHTGRFEVLNSILLCLIYTTFVISTEPIKDLKFEAQLRRELSTVTDVYRGEGRWTSQELQDLSNDPIIRTWHVIYIQRPFEAYEVSVENYARRIDETIELQNLAMEFHNIPQRITKGNVYAKHCTFYDQEKSSCSESLQQCKDWADELGREEGSWDLWMCSVPPLWRPDCGGLAYQPGDVSIMGEYCWYDSKFGCNGILHEMGHNFMAEHHIDFCYPEMQGVSNNTGWITLMGGGAACSHTDEQRIFVYTDSDNVYCEKDQCVTLGNDQFDNASRMRYSLHVLLQGPIPDCPGADDRNVCLGMKNKFCTQNWNLGYFFSPADCAAYIIQNHFAICSSNIFGYAMDSWGCRCCTKGYNDPDLHDHLFWSLYEVGSGTLAPSASPVSSPPTQDPTVVSISLVSSQTSCTYGATIPDATPDWDCRCCANGDQSDFDYHEWWSIYNLNDESGHSQSLDFSPQNGTCPDGYALAYGQIADDIVGCGGSLSFWSCILSKSDAEKLCNMIPCQIVSETSSISWLSSYPNAVIIGLETTSTKSDSEWKSCVKLPATTTSTENPSEQPSANPTTTTPTGLPTLISTERLTTQSPTDFPVSSSPTTKPSTSRKSPSKFPFPESPSITPTCSPTTTQPSSFPITHSPSISPSADSPTTSPSADSPTLSPTTNSPTFVPSSSMPTTSPTSTPTNSPVAQYTVEFTFTSLSSCDIQSAIAAHNYYLQLSEIYFYDEDQNRITYTSFVSPNSDSPGSEKPDRVLDGNTNTKWLDRSFSCSDPVVGVASGFSKAPVYYTFVTANDSPPRDPNGWEVRICRDEVCDTPIIVENQTPPSSRRTQYSELYDFFPVSEEPSLQPSYTSPTEKPLTTSPSTSRPTRIPSLPPVTSRPTDGPTTFPTNSLPTNTPSFHPTTSKPSQDPTVSPSISRPTNIPTTTKPTFQPSDAPFSSRPTDMPFTSNPTTMPISSTPTGYPTVTNPGDCGGMSVEKTNECLRARIYWLERELEDTREVCASDRQYCEDTKADIISILASQR